MLIYEFPSSSLRCRANPNLFRRSFEPYEQILYNRMVLEPHMAYPIPAGTRYILLTKNETERSKSLQATASYPGSCTFRDKQTTFGRTAQAFLQEVSKLFITPIIRPSVAPVLIARSSTTLATPQPVSIPEPPVRTTPQILLPDPPPELTTPLVQIPDPPVQIPVFQPPVQISPVPTTPPVEIPDPPPVPTTPHVHLFLPDPPPVQILLPDPPPVVETLESTLMDDSSIDHIMSSVFGDCSQLPPAYTEEPQLLDTVPSLFDESNDLISFLDNFENGLAIEQQEAPMDLTMPRMKKKVINTTGFKVIKPLDLSVRISTRGLLDLNWDKGVELRFFQVGRPPSHRVWEAYQPQTTDASSLDFTDCPRVADVYVKWLTWLDDWEMHRDETVPWHMVGLQPWKRALEKHVQRSHEKALANEMPSDVTLLEHI
ncbi:hypothetical protein TNCV_86561 [Trichonephila clavipes]|nr:hypothetical protein TNCV_86561 [Trichonephila clavipes]